MVKLIMDKFIMKTTSNNKRRTMRLGLATLLFLSVLLSSVTNLKIQENQIEVEDIATTTFE